MYELTESNAGVSKHFHGNASAVSALGHFSVAVTSAVAQNWTREELCVVTPLLNIMHLLVMTGGLYARPAVQLNFWPLFACK